jgi:hypothetical protein
LPKEFAKLYGVERMKPIDIPSANRHQVRAAVGRYRTANLRGFGSLVHGTYQDGSDIDLLVDALPGATLFDLGGLQEGLESILGQTL